MMRRVQAWPIVMADGLQLGRSPIEARTLVSLTAKVAAFLWRQQSDRSR